MGAASINTRQLFVNGRWVETLWEIVRMPVEIKPSDTDVTEL